MHFLAFDTNIYREFGVSFQSNIDFSYLSKFLEKGPHELVMLDVVFNELKDYFNQDIIGRLIKDYRSVYSRFERIEFLPDLDKPDFVSLEAQAKVDFEKKLRSSCWKILASEPINHSDLLEFLIVNKRESGKDNTRDFMIWQGLINLAKLHPDDKVILISKDSIFTKNEFFQSFLESNSVENLIVLDSVSKYMSDYNLKVDFINNQLIEKSISNEVILKEIKNDIECFPSYVSSYYYSGENRPPSNLSVEILDVSINDYYTYSENKSNTTLITSLIVRVKSVYDKETSVDLRNYQKKFYYPEVHHRIDQENRPIYENNLLFIFEANLDLENKKIGEQRFIDFIPDWNINK